ncbi:MAG: hypothetical protein K8L99_19785, partial [Anaerolineae bacterium]|nr:hypothetical protein [Anaerolineae bacterium]
DSALQAGDVVDIEVEMLFVEADEQMDQSDGESPTPQLTTERIIQNALVVGTGPDGSIVTLAVSPQDAEILVWVLEAKLPITLLFHQIEHPPA